jgi:hypothetical protein
MCHSIIINQVPRAINFSRGRNKFSSKTGIFKIKNAYICNKVMEAFLNETTLYNRMDVRAVSWIMVGLVDTISY